MIQKNEQNIKLIIELENERNFHNYMRNNYVQCAKFECDRYIHKETVHYKSKKDDKPVCCKDHRS
jgi:hypothetical protein